MSSENCKPAPEVVDIVRAMARNRVAAGITNPADVIDAIHAAIHPHTALWKSEIADIVSGAVGKQKRTLSELQKNLAAMKAELRDLSRTQDALRDGGASLEAKRIAAKEKRLQTEVADLNRRVDYEQPLPEKRTSIPDTEESARLRSERDRLKEILRKETNPPPANKPADIHAAVNKRVAADARRRIEEIDRMLANKGQKIDKPGLPKRLTDETKRLIALRDQKTAELKALREKLAATRDAPVETGVSHEPKQAPQDRTRQAQLRKQMADIKEQIRTGDFSTAKREPPRYNDETHKLEAERDRLRAQADTEIRRIEYKNRSPIRKALDASYHLMHAAILSSPTVFAHLAGASAWRLVSTVLEDAFDAGLRTVSKSYRGLSNKAPIEGGGFQIGSHLEGLKAAFGPATWRAIRDKLARGASDRAILYGGKDHRDPGFTPRIFGGLRRKYDVLNYPLLDLVGKIHDVIKTPIEHYAFARAFYRGSQHMRRELAAAGKSEEAIDRAMATDSAQAALAARAYESSLAAKLQGDNKVVDAYNQALKRLESSGDFGAAIAAMVRFETPIVRIPFNYASEAFSYLGGGAKAASKLGAVSRDKRALTPDEADYVVRNIKKQGIGVGLLALGFFGYEHFGGLYRKGKNQPNREIPVGDAEFDGVELSHHVTHSPMWGVMQAGALMHYALLEDLAYAAKRKEEGAELRAATAAVGQSVMALLMDVPVIDIVNDMEKIGQGGKGAARLAGKKVAQYIPGFAQWWARSEDVDEAGEPIKRDPQGFIDEIKMALPGYREEVPEKKRHH